MKHPFIQKPITFTVDGYRLSGVLHLPPGDNLPVVIGSHGLFSDGDSPKQLELADRCNGAGIAYFRLHHRGCGKSSGDFQTATSLDGRRRDLTAAAGVLAARSELNGRIGLFGSSLGGATCLAAADTLRPERIVTIAAPVDSRSLLDQPERPGGADVPDAFRRPSLQFDLLDRLSAISGILVFHGDQDATIPFAHGQALYAAAAEPKKLIVNKGGDHRMSRRDHQERFLDEAVRWFSALAAN